MQVSECNAHYPVVIVGGGHSGLSLSVCLRERGIDHLVIEKRSVVHSWRTQRWDSFSLVTPNWQCQLPGWPYRGSDPHGFMVKHEINQWLAGFVKHAAAPVVEGVAVTRVAPAPAGFVIETSQRSYTADQVVVASGGCHKPIVPRLAERLPASIAQFHSAEYRSPSKLPEGRVLVVGSGQSGAEIAEDLHLAGRGVVLATGDAPRCARVYRGRDVTDWLHDMGHVDTPGESHPLREGLRGDTRHPVTGRDGRRDLDLRRFALEGMQLYGRLEAVDTGPEGEALQFQPNLRRHLDAADAAYNGLNALIDRWVDEQGLEAPPAAVYTPVWAPTEERRTLKLRGSGITSVVWCIGFAPDFGWVDAPVFNGRGHPVHQRGVTQVPGLYFLGLPGGLQTWGSGRFPGIARDAEHLAASIEAAQRPVLAAEREGEGEAASAPVFRVARAA